jgi:hypothetical protein
MTTGTTMTKHTNEDLTPKDGQCWGNWCLNLRKAQLEYRSGAHEYEIDLDPKTSPMSPVGWFVHMMDKAGMTPEDLGNLLKAIDQIYDLRRYVYGGKQPSDQAAMQEALDRLRGTR